MSGSLAKSSETTPAALPSLPLDEWEDTKETLHRYAQIVGKIRLGYAPYRNHWWHVPLCVSTLGLTTRPIPYRRMTFEISFNFLDNKLEASTSEGGYFAFVLDDLPVAEQLREPAFYAYAAPEPEGLTDQPLRPQTAFWAPEGGTALLMYEEVRKSSSPKETLLEFLESAYRAGAKTANWDAEELRSDAQVEEL